MKITNLNGLPEPLVRAITYSDYNKEGCDYSISDLLRPPRMAQLERQYADQITEDASDRLWMLLGSAGHEVLRRSAGGDGIVEVRAIAEVDGFKVGGQIDYAKADVSMTDWKFTSVYAAKEGPRDEWCAQLNCYRWLAAQYGVTINKLQIVCIFRDWSKSKAPREPDYQQSQVKVLDIPMWNWDKSQSFISHRIQLHEHAKRHEAFCTPEETWERPATYAVKKPGNKRATKLCLTMGEARELITQLGTSMDIEVRPAERPRCADYCRCAPFCDQWKAFQKDNP